MKSVIEGAEQLEQRILEAVERGSPLSEWLNYS